MMFAAAGAALPWFVWPWPTAAAAVCAAAAVFGLVLVWWGRTSQIAAADPVTEPAVVLPPAGMSEDYYNGWIDAVKAHQP